MRLRIAEALQNIKDTLGLPILVHQLYDTSYIVKVAAISGIADLGKKAIDTLKWELKRVKNDEHKAIIIKTIRKTYEKLETSAKTPEFKKELAELVKKYLGSDYPALKKEAQYLIDAVEARGVLEPEELFIFPSSPLSPF